MTDTLCLYAPGSDFVIKYIKAAMPGTTIVGPDDITSAGMAVMISSADIYGAGQFELRSEDEALDKNSVWYEYENEFTARCRRANIRGLVLRCPDIVCTGMTGFTRHLANAIWRGTFFHFPGNDARRSVVHATDIAEAIILACKELTASADIVTYNICDGVNPTLHDLAEALAFRMSNKRISNLSTKPQQIIGRLIYGRRRYAEYTDTRTLSCAAICRDLGFRPTDVCSYLRTHNYDDTSL